MKLFVPILCAAVVVGMTASSASAFTQEPIRGGGSGGSALADPSEQYRVRGDADATPENRGPRAESSPFSLGVIGPDPRNAPRVHRPGPDNNHLFWNNSSSYWR